MCGPLGGSHTGFTVSAGLVGDAELAEVAADHVELDLHIVEGLSVVNSNVVSDHLGHHNRISEVGLHWGWLLSGKSVLL